LDFRVLDGDGQGSAFMVAEAIVRAVDMGAALINMSLGLYRETTLLREAVRYADEQGVLMVAAAGNDGLPRLTYPAAYSAVLSVTAVDGSGRQAVFPNRSESIDFAAPGVGVVVADPEGGYRQISGTSAAAPFVSGTLAALLSTDLTQSPEAAVRLLEKHLNEAGALGSDEKYGGGLLDWDRLRERNTQDFQDVALAAIHMDLDSQPGTRVPINVVVQNRGTAWLPEVELAVVQLGEATEHFTITSLAPGAVAERTVYRLLPSKGFENAIELGARAGLKDANQDQRPENNAHLARFQSTEVE
jgi:subtilisin family serine protease